MDRALLFAAIERSGIKQYKLAEALNLSRTGFALKVSGENDFKMGEIAALSKVLNLNAQERDAIFFADNVD
ncbi:MAG: DUF739 family protein [Negativicoccus succinicivorans]|uniref:DUF739 family protein n=1 Tax=Negativicoccus succinicivorans TaxID=620903 RepID=UPI002355C768|nr:DUF739 family protein [Negativicoccus succinicivorans]MBS5890636.1 DUF739 family protein [Negativicoccus succinicivorans]